MRYLNVILTVIFLLSITSCSEIGVLDDSTDTIKISDSDNTEITELTPNLPTDKSYDNYAFTILITGNTENNWIKNDFKADEQNGEVLNDARYERNVSVEEMFNVKIITYEQYGSAKGDGTGYQLISRNVMAGDTEYDACMSNVYDISNLACSGYLYDLNSLPYLNLTNPWWDQKANEDLSILGKMYFTTGDISTVDNDSTYCILFNKDLFKDYDLENPYDLVYDGKWTFDKMVELGMNTVIDLDGNGTFDKNDSFAAIVWDDTIMGAVNGSLEKCASINNEGKIELSLYNERVVSILQKYTDFVFNNEICYQYQRISYDITDALSMFSSNRSLFFLQMLDLTSYFRDMETDFGILPYPKYDEDQKTYGHTIGSWHSMFLCVPLLVNNVEMSGVILEALAYYEKTLIGKYVRDDESIDMLDIILSTRVYDVGWYYQIGKYNDEILYMVYESDPNFTSRYSKHEQTASEDINRINLLFDENLK